MPEATRKISLMTVVSLVVLMGLALWLSWPLDRALGPPLLLASVSFLIVLLARGSYHRRPFASATKSLKLSGAATAVILWILCFAVLQVGYLLTTVVQAWQTEEAAEKGAKVTISVGRQE